MKKLSASKQNSVPSTVMHLQFLEVHIILTLPAKKLKTFIRKREKNVKFKKKCTLFRENKFVLYFLYKLIIKINKN